MRSLIVTTLVLGAATATAAPIALTSDKQSHGAITVAAGAGAYVIAWESQPARGKRSVLAAIVDDKGTIVVPPKVVRARYNVAASIGAVWNGTAFTIVACDGVGNAKIAWGDLALDGTWTRGGEAKLPVTGDVRTCSTPVVSGGTITLAASATTDVDDEGEGSGLACTTKRLTLAGKKLTAGKALSVCNVAAAGPDWLVGSDPDYAVVASTKDKKPAAIPDSVGKLWWSTGGTRTLGARERKTSGDAYAIETFALEAPFTRLGTPTLLQGSNARGVTGIVTLPTGVATLASTHDKGFTATIYGADGKQRSTTTTGTRIHRMACAPGAALACAWSDDNKQRGEVQLVLLPL